MPYNKIYYYSNSTPNFLWGFGAKGRVGRVYSYSFNGKETDNEISGVGNSIHFEFREYDPRIARMKSIDPDASKYPWQSPYVYHRNSPVWLIDYLGKGEKRRDKLFEKNVKKPIEEKGKEIIKNNPNITPDEFNEEIQSLADQLHEKYQNKKWYRKKLLALSKKGIVQGSNHWTVKHSFKLYAELRSINYAELTASSGWYGSIYKDPKIQIGGRPYEYIITYLGGETTGGYDYDNGITVVEIETDGDELVPDQLKVYTKDNSGNFKVLGGTDSRSTKPMVTILNSETINYRIYIEVSMISDGKNTHPESSTKININVYGFNITSKQDINEEYAKP